MKRPSTSAAMKLACLIAHAADVRCAMCKEHFFIATIEYDHHHALVHGGEHSADALRPLCKPCHKIKTAQDVKDNAKVKRIIKKRAGLTKPKRKIPSRPFR